MSQIIIGTAGHIDHGKTALVQALTGVNTDRLKEEQERGLTIDIGFAHWDERATIIDVPGHEKFIRNMVAGVSTIDLVLFVIAADDGVMPQTREHLDILNILQVPQGVIALTKIDLVEEEWLRLVEEDVRNLMAGSFLQDARVFRVSSVTGDGIPELRKHIESAFGEIKSKQDKGIFWLPIDRAFSMKGFGTIVTGTVLAGAAKNGDGVELLPQKEQTKIRGLQSHDHPVEQVSTGDRAAINLQSVDKKHIHRGDVLAAPGYFKPSQRVDTKLRLLKSAPRNLRHRTRVRVHVGTAEVMARVSLFDKSKIIKPGEEGYAQLDLEAPAAARRMDRFVIRQYSPTITIGGGVILDPNAPRHRGSDTAALERLQALEKENPAEVIEGTLLSSELAPIAIESLASAVALPQEQTETILHELKQAKKVFFLKKHGKPAVLHRRNFERLCKDITDSLAAFHEKHPAKFGMQKSELKKSLKPSPDQETLASALEELVELNKLKESAGVFSTYDHQIALSPELQDLKEKIAEVWYEEGFTTSSAAELREKLGADESKLRQVIELLIGLGEIYRLEGDIFFHAERVEEARKNLVQFLEKNEEITVGQFKELLDGASRKFAMPLLNYFDGSGVTERVGDVRILRE